jgi:hypothetical protein
MLATTGFPPRRGALTIEAMDFTSKNRLLVLGAVIVGAAFMAAALMYWTAPPKSLPGPSFLGHEDGVSAVHVKHGIGCFFLGLACFAFAWFRSGPKPVASL